MNNVKTENKEKLKEILDDLEGFRSRKSEEWNLIITKNKAKFERIKSEIRKKQDELTTLVKKRQALTISNEDFNEKSQEIQRELYELEKEILNLRLCSRKL